MATALSVHRLYRFDEFELDPARRSLSRDGAAVPLSAKAFDVLSYLARNPGRVVTKDELLKAAWPESFVEESNLPVYISMLRKAFGDRAHYIATVPGTGYQFTANVQVETPGVSEPPPQPQIIRETARIVIRETSSSSRPALPVSAPSLLRRAVALPAALGLIAVAGAGYGIWRYTRPTAPPMVVLSDFENATGDPKLDRVLDGALEIDLRQSPYLSFLSNAKIQETLTEMQRPKGAPLAPEVAREVCERNNAQVALHGVVAKFGQRYLITLKATDCQSGNNLGDTKREATIEDEIPHAIDLVAADMRKRLGESRASIQQYNTPLFAENTNSFEALQRYSEASQVGLRGKCGDAIALFKRAIELDPKFAMAYADMAACYGNLGELALQKENLAKAYELRDSVAEQDRLYLAARYSEVVTGDLIASIATHRLWTSIYPRNAVAWGELANIYTQLGEAELAIPPARQALALNPSNAAAYVILSRALMHAGQLDEAKAVAEQAVQKGVAGGDLHSMLMEIAAARHDPAGIEEQVKWAESSSNPSRMKLNEALIAFSHGQARLGRQLMSAMADYYKQQGLANVGVRYLVASARMIAEEGYPEDAKKMLDANPPPPGLTDPVVALAEAGEPDRANAILKQEMAEHPQDTLWLEYRGPQIQAAILRAERKPQEALDALTHAVPVDYRGYDTLLLRGETYLDLKQPVPAAQEFQRILDRPGLDPFSHDYPLAQLGLARALAAQGNRSASATAYQAFFAMWKDADPDLPLLREARREYSSLTGHAD